MNDTKIISLFWNRSEQAISELAEKYGRLVYYICNGILNNHEDVTECVNDTYLGVWHAIPPQRPSVLQAFVCRIARNISLKKHRFNTAAKRDSQFIVSMEELEDVFYSDSIEEIISAKELGNTINNFLTKLDDDNRKMFVQRYWYCAPVKDIAAHFHLSQNHVSVKLSRIRNELKEYLKREGYYE